MSGELTKARASLRRKGVLTLGELAESIAGEPIRGSWWGHRKGKLIYAVANALEDDADVLACKLLGKVTFVDRALWPALHRVVTDPGWRKSALKRLSPTASAFARRVRKPTRISKETLEPRDKVALEKSCILHMTSEHTDHRRASAGAGRAGAHATVVRSWKAWAPADVEDASAKLSFADARAALVGCGLAL